MENYFKVKSTMCKSSTLVPLQIHMHTVIQATVATVGQTSSSLSVYCLPQLSIRVLVYFPWLAGKLGKESSV